MKIIRRPFLAFCQYCHEESFLFWTIVAAFTLVEPILCARRPEGLIFFAQFVVLSVSTVLYFIQLFGNVTSQWKKILQIDATFMESLHIESARKEILKESIFVKAVIFFSSEGIYLLELFLLGIGWSLLFIWPGLAALRCFRVFRLLWFYEVEVFKSTVEATLEPLLGEAFVARLFKVMKFAINSLSAIGDEIFRLTEDTRGGLFLIMIFFYSAYVVATTLWIETNRIDQCDSIGLCMFTLLRLTFFDGNGFDFAFTLTENHKFLFCITMLYMIMTSFGILNGLVGIFGTVFARSSHYAFDGDIDEEDTADCGDEDGEMSMRDEDEDDITMRESQAQQRLLQQQLNDGKLDDADDTGIGNSSSRRGEGKVSRQGSSIRAGKAFMVGGPMGGAAMSSMVASSTSSRDHGQESSSSTKRRAQTPERHIHSAKRAKGRSRSPNKTVSSSGTDESAVERTDDNILSGESKNERSMLNSSGDDGDDETVEKFSLSRSDKFNNINSYIEPHARGSVSINGSPVQNPISGSSGAIASFTAVAGSGAAWSPNRSGVGDERAANVVSSMMNLQRQKSALDMKASAAKKTSKMSFENVVHKRMVTAASKKLLLMRQSTKPNILSGSGPATGASTYGDAVRPFASDLDLKATPQKNKPQQIGLFNQSFLRNGVTSIAGANPTPMRAAERLNTAAAMQGVASDVTMYVRELNGKIHKLQHRIDAQSEVLEVLLHRVKDYAESKGIEVKPAR